MEVQGLNIESIAKEFGTPVYLYDAEIIERQVGAFKSAFPNINLDIKYACKSNTNLSILKKMLELGTGLDTVSINEIKMGLMVGFAPDQIVFTPNCVDFSEITEAVDLGVRINIENLPNIEKFADKYGDSVPCFVRLNPQVHSQANSEKVDWWHKQSKFGIALDQLPAVHRLIAEKGLKVNGIHIHSSSVIMTPEVFLEGAKTVFDIAKQFKDLEFLDFGGGIKVEVGDGTPVIDLQELGAQFEPVFQKFCEEIGKPIELWFEPGRFLIAEAGMLLVTTNVVKRNFYIDNVTINLKSAPRTVFQPNINGGAAARGYRVPMNGIVSGLFWLFVRVPKIDWRNTTYGRAIKCCGAVPIYVASASPVVGAFAYNANAVPE